MKTASKNEFTSKCFSPKLYLQSLKNSKVAGIGFLIIVLVVNALWVIGSAWGSSPFKTEVFTVTGGNIAPVSFLVFLSGAFLAYDHFGFLFKRKTSDFFHTLPQTRLCVFITFVASIFTWILLTILATFLTCAAIWSAFEFYAVEWSALLPMILGTFGSCAVFSGLVSLAILLSGTNSAFGAYLIAILGAPRVILNVFAFLVDHFSFTVEAKYTWLKYLEGIDYSYLFSIFNSGENKLGRFGSPAFNVFLLIEALVIFAIVGIIFVRRKSEYASTPFVYKSVHIALRSLIIVAILAGMFALGEIDPLIVGFTIILHFIFDLVSLKSAKTAAKSLVWYLLPVCLCFVIVGSALLTEKTFELFSPDEKNVVSISLHNEDNEKFEYFSNCNEINFNLWTKNKEAINAALNAYSESESLEYNDEIDYFSVIFVKFKKESGSECIRRVLATEQQIITILGGIKSEEENKETLSLPDWDKLKDPKIFIYSSIVPLTKEMYEQFKEEYTSLPFEKQAESEMKVDNIYIRFDLDGKTLFFLLSRESFPKTTSLIHNSHSSAKYEKHFKDALKALKDNENSKTRMIVMPTSKFVSYSDEEFICAELKKGAPFYKLYDALSESELSQPSEESKEKDLYHVKLLDEYYFFYLDDNVISLLEDMRYNNSGELYD